MNKAIRVTASALGVYAGLLGAAHGAFEMKQGNAAPDGVLINAMGPPCQADAIYHACFPALTVVHNFLASGVLAIVVGLVTAIWATAFVQRKNGGLVLILLSILLFPIGGGFIPVFVGIIAGTVGTRINGALPWWRAHLSGNPSRLLAALWPGSLVLYFLYVLGLAIVGGPLNEVLLALGPVSLLIEFALLLWAVVAAFAHDTQIKPVQK